jgi:hypothetical protein
MHTEVKPAVCSSNWGLAHQGVGSLLLPHQDACPSSHRLLIEMDVISQQNQTQEILLVRSFCHLTVSSSKSAPCLHHHISIITCCQVGLADSQVHHSHTSHITHHTSHIMQHTTKPGDSRQGQVCRHNHHSLPLPFKPLALS